MGLLLFVPAGSIHYWQAWVYLSVNPGGAGHLPLQVVECSVLMYLRQSSPGQVRDHVVATQEQYRLREIAETLGFPVDRVPIVDEDLGISGQTIVGRKGMLKVLDLLEREEVACVVVRDIGRLTRDEFTFSYPGGTAPLMFTPRACFAFR